MQYPNECALCFVSSVPLSHSLSFSFSFHLLSLYLYRFTSLYLYTYLYPRPLPLPIPICKQKTKTCENVKKGNEIRNIWNDWVLRKNWVLRVRSIIMFTAGGCANLPAVWTTLLNLIIQDPTKTVFYHHDGIYLLTLALQEAVAITIAETVSISIAIWYMHNCRNTICSDHCI